MTHIRRRTTKAGSASTALFESYRDEKGRPRQRLLANLHGEPDIVSALAKLEVQRDAMRKREDGLLAEAQSEDDKMMVAEFFGDDLAAMENEISIIKKHCSATPDEIQAAIKAHKIALDDAVALAIWGHSYSCIVTRMHTRLTRPSYDGCAANQKRTPTTASNAA